MMNKQRGHFMKIKKLFIFFRLIFGDKRSFLGKRQNTFTRTDVYTVSAFNALVIVYYGKIVAERNSVSRTVLFAPSAADTAFFAYTHNLLSSTEV